MKKKSNHSAPGLLFITASLMMFTQCVTPFESARMLPKGGTEIKAAYTHVRDIEEGDNTKLNDGLGVGIGYGISKKVNFKIRYERVSFEDNINFFAFGPKVALKQDRIAAALPIWFYFSGGETTWGTSPTFIFNILPPSKEFETSLGLKSDISFEKGSDLLVGANLGFGISKDLDKWAIRPDIGVEFNPGYKAVLLSFGIGFQYNIVRTQKNK